FPTFCPIGPYIVSNIDMSDLEIKAVLSGEVKQLSSTKHFLWNPYELVSFISRSIPLEPGDVVTTGTPSGVGPMQPGDIITIEIENVGALTNPVVYV
ncbi:MAG: fumarylacetoacetate hydrolase family protein, partial [Clostridia bacterium]|nr:fumarylacetoacetate hydrolase family protein [Clostridia bacterium]